MKVLHVYKSCLYDGPGGVERVIEQLCHSTTKCGVENMQLALSHHPLPSPIQQKHCKLYRAQTVFEISSTPLSFSVFRTFQLLAKQAQIIHYHFPWPLMDVLHLIYASHRPSLVTYHADIVKQKRLFMLYRPIMQRFLHSVHAIVTTSPNYANTSPILQKYKHKLHTIPIGLDEPMELQTDVARSDHWRKKLGEQFFLFIGALRYYKGLDTLLKAICNTNIKLVIAGTGDREVELKALASRFKLQNVIFLNEISEQDKHILLSLCFCFVFPSHLRSEAFGVALLESAIHSKPAISCSIQSGNSYVNIHKHTGLVVSPQDHMMLREAMLHLQDNPNLAAHYGKNARDRYFNLFTADMQANSYMKLYQDLIDN